MANEEEPRKETEDVKEETKGDKEWGDDDIDKSGEPIEFLPWPKVKEEATIKVSRIFETKDTKITSKAPSGLIELGRTGIKVAPVGFGASRTMEPSLVNAAIDAGFLFLDTGRSYARGKNEFMVGEVIEPRRKQVVVQSKLRVRLRSQDDGSFAAEDVKKTIDSMADSMETSLKALRTDYIDIMLIHGASDPKVIYLEDVMAFFEKAKKEGKNS